MTNQSEVTVLLLGDAGVGKSTFLSYVLASGCSQTPLLRLHFGHFPRRDLNF